MIRSYGPNAAVENAALAALRKGLGWEDAEREDPPVPRETYWSVVRRLTATGRLRAVLRGDA